MQTHRPTLSNLSPIKPLSTAGHNIMSSRGSMADLRANLRKSFGEIKLKEIVEDNKQEVLEFFGQTSEKVAKLYVSVNEQTEENIKRALKEKYGREYGTEAVLNRLDDYINFLNHVCQTPVKKLLNIYKFDKQAFREVF